MKFFIVFGLFLVNTVLGFWSQSEDEVKLFRNQFVPIADNHLRLMQLYLRRGDGQSFSKLFRIPTNIAFAPETSAQELMSNAREHPICHNGLRLLLASTPEPIGANGIRFKYKTIYMKKIDNRYSKRSYSRIVTITPKPDSPSGWAITYMAQ
ncbi:unnamed protein product [Caenorhabditis bovis]|uniref:Uncharacterized protein n=1 Tax=Caenorhabditis bovis TaxID=2654633 RepID=A0A8S1EM84_9PELO|nr:unnamed protein product [Caenorhabditis bovis]